MNAEIQSIIRNLRNVLEGQPWYGRPVMALIGDVDPTIVYKKPGETQHSLIDLLYHMIAWAEFVAGRMEKEPPPVEEMEELDWRQIDPVTHTWHAGVEQLKAANEKIIRMLEQKDDSLLSQPVEGREYKFRFLLHGHIQHLIYHAGQIAYVKKLLQGS